MFVDKCFIKAVRDDDMTHAKTSNISTLTANPGSSLCSGKKCVADFRFQRQSGFSLLEALIVLAIIATMTSLTVLGVRSILPGLRANRAMYQVVDSLREARMLAMSQNSMVSMQFSANNEISMQIRNAGAAAFRPILGTPQEFDPSIILDNDFQFVRTGPTAGTDTGDALTGGHGEAIVFGQMPVEIPLTGATVGRTFVFTADGFLTESTDLYDLINGTIFIGLPDGGENMMRAVTILGATGRVRAWQWRNGGWLPVR